LTGKVKEEHIILSAEVDDAKLMTGFEALLMEAFRVERHGFTQTELDRQKADVLKYWKDNITREIKLIQEYLPDSMSVII